MLRDLLDKFSGRQLTAIILAAILVPGAVGAAVTFNPVAIVDPLTGKQSAVDAARRLLVVDNLAAYENNPQNYVRISGLALGNGSTYQIYTVPAGKSLIIKSVNTTYSGGRAGWDNWIYFYHSTTGPENYIIGFDEPGAMGGHNVSLGNGFYVHSGEALLYKGGTQYGYTYMLNISIEGYLVPSTAVPAVPAEQMVHFQHGPAKK